MLSSYWVNFAANGDPNGKGLAKWPAFDDQKERRADGSGRSGGSGTRAESGQLAFFESVYEKEHGSGALTPGRLNPLPWAWSIA